MNDAISTVKRCPPQRSASIPAVHAGIQENVNRSKRKREIMKHCEPSYLLETPVSDASRSLDAVIMFFRETRSGKLRLVLTLAIMTLGIALPSYGQGSNVFNCPSGFASSGSCGVSANGGSAAFWSENAISGSKMPLVLTGCVHCGTGLNYQTKVNEQAFSSTFTFVPDGWTLAFVLQNNTNLNASGGGCSGSKCLFAAGAGCEAGFYQAFDSNNTPPTDIFALDLSSYDYTNGNSFTSSNVQIYQQAQSPCIPNDDQTGYYVTNKISTSPVLLTSSTNAMNSYTGDTYSVTLNYTGTNLVMNMYDVTAGGSCPGASCFSYTWNGVNIPSLVGSTSAYVGLTSGTGDAPTTTTLYVDSFAYTALSPANTPSFSPAAGSYAGPQSVTISDLPSGAIICYNTTGAPATNGTTGCTNGTLYSGAIPVPSGQTIYAVAGGTGYGDSPIGSAAYQINSTAAQPTFNLGTAKYQGDQTLMISDATPSSTIYYTTDGSTPTTGSSVYSAPIAVSATQTVQAIATASGVTQSTAGSVTLTINPYAGTAPANSPIYSPLPGSYASTQSVTLASTTPSSYICYILAASPPTLLPQTNNEGGCIEGTLYSGPISVSSSQTVYAMASTPRLGPPSSLAVGAYVIGGTQTPGMPTNVKVNAVPQ
jgi:hypothetical protein